LGFQNQKKLYGHSRLNPDEANCECSQFLGAGRAKNRERGKGRE
jgi:hypothetical protein